MKLELKKVKTFRGNEGYGLNCEVYVDGIKTAYYIDDASGGGGRIEQVFNKEKLAELEAYAKAQPRREFDLDTLGAIKDAKPHTYAVDIDILIDEEFNRMEREKADNKLAKKFADTFIIGKPGGESYREVYWLKDGKRIVFAKATEKGIQNLQSNLDKIRAGLKDGEQVLNTNLAELGLK